MQRLRALLSAALITALVLPTSAFGAITSRINSVSFVDSQKGFMAGRYEVKGERYGFVSSTTDGGVTWKVAPSFKYRAMVGVDALTASSAWVVSDYWNYAWRTTNGTTWSQSAGKFGLSAVPNPTDVVQVASNTAVVVGQQVNVPDYGDLATIWRTVDGGASWSKVHDWKRYTPNSDGSIDQAWATYTAIDRSPTGSVLMAVGEERQKNGGGQGFKQAIVAISTNGGASWTDVASPPSGTRLADVSVVGDSVAWAVGYGSAIKTTNGGGTWTSKTIPRSLGMNGIDATSDKHAVVVGNNGRIRRTIDGGSTWKEYTTPSALALHSVKILSSTRAIAVGDDQLIAYLTLKSDGTVTGTEMRAVNGAVSSPDKTAPAPKHGSVTYTNKRTDVALSATDTGGSGVAGIQYRTNGGTTTTISAASGKAALIAGQKSVKLGNNTLYYRAFDKAGNYSPWKSVTVYVKYTSLSFSGSSTPAYAKASVYGYLKYATTSGSMAPLTYKSVRIEQYKGGKWVYLATAKTSSTGRWSYTLKPTTKTTYRVRYIGSASSQLSQTTKKTIVPKVALSTPVFRSSTAGSKSVTSLTYGKTYLVNGTLKPRHASGSKQIKIKAYRWNGSTYVYKKTYTATASNYSSYSRYSAKIKLPSKGTWRLRAYHAADSTNAKTYSSYRKVRVK